MIKTFTSNALNIRSTPWRLTLSKSLNTNTAHYISLSFIICIYLISLVTILLSLFACEEKIKADPKVRLAEEILRWTDVGFLALMVIEVIVRSLLVGFSYFRPIIHILDAIILVTLLIVESTVAEEFAAATAGLLISLRILRIIKQLREVASISEVMNEVSKKRECT